MKIRPGHNSDGIALIIALIAILVLSALAAGFALSMKVETRLAFNANSETQLYWLGRSGVEYCRWVLAQEKCPYDSLNQIWAGGPGSECDTNLEVENPVHVGDGTCTWKIIDLERYANINTANALEIQQALTLMGVDANELSVVADSIQDWIGPARRVLPARKAIIIRDSIRLTMPRTRRLTTRPNCCMSGEFWITRKFTLAAARRTIPARRSSTSWASATRPARIRVIRSG